MYIQNGRGMQVLPPAFNPSSNPYHVHHYPSAASTHSQMSPYQTTMTNSHQVQSPPQVMSNGVGPSPQMYGSVYNTPENHTIKIEADSFMVDSPSACSDPQSPYYIIPVPAPFISTSQPSGAIDPGLPDGIMTNHHSSGYSDTPESASPYQQQSQQPLDVLQLPQGMNQPMGQDMAPDGGGGWISPNSHSQTNSPRYSPDPNELPASAGFSINSMGMGMNPQPPQAVGPMAMASPPMQHCRLSSAHIKAHDMFSSSA